MEEQQGRAGRQHEHQHQNVQRPEQPWEQHRERAQGHQKRQHGDQQQQQPGHRQQEQQQQQQAVEDMEEQDRRMGAAWDVIVCGPSASPSPSHHARTAQTPMHDGRGDALPYVPMSPSLSARTATPATPASSSLHAELSSTPSTAAATPSTSRTASGPGPRGAGSTVTAGATPSAGMPPSPGTSRPPLSPSTDPLLRSGNGLAAAPSSPPGPPCVPFAPPDSLLRFIDGLPRVARCEQTVLLREVEADHLNHQRVLRDHALSFLISSDGTAPSPPLAPPSATSGHAASLGSPTSERAPGPERADAASSRPTYPPSGLPTLVHVAAVSPASASSFSGQANLALGLGQSPIRLSKYDSFGYAAPGTRSFAVHVSQSITRRREYEDSLPSKLESEPWGELPSPSSSSTPHRHTLPGDSAVATVAFTALSKQRAMAAIAELDAARAAAATAAPAAEPSLATAASAALLPRRTSASGSQMLDSPQQQGRWAASSRVLAALDPAYGGSPVASSSGPENVPSSPDPDHPAAPSSPSSSSSPWTQRTRASSLQGTPGTAATPPQQQQPQQRHPLRSSHARSARLSGLKHAFGSPLAHNLVPFGSVMAPPALQPLDPLQDATGAIERRSAGDRATAAGPVGGMPHHTPRPMRTYRSDSGGSGSGPSLLPPSLSTSNIASPSSVSGGPPPRLEQLPSPVGHAGSGLARRGSIPGYWLRPGSGGTGATLAAMATPSPSRSRVPPLGSRTSFPLASAPERGGGSGSGSPQGAATADAAATPPPLGSSASCTMLPAGSVNGVSGNGDTGTAAAPLPSPPSPVPASKRNITHAAIINLNLVVGNSSGNGSGGGVHVSPASNRVPPALGRR